MNDKLTVACIQNCAGPSLESNIEECTGFVRDAHRDGADLVCLPEYFSCLDVAETGFELGATIEEEHPALAQFSALAKELEVWILLGSLAIKAGPTKIRNRSYLIDGAGNVTARYDKIHLFDVELANGETYRESDGVEPGHHAIIAPTPWGTLGLSVCYDLRFAYLYRALAQAGASILTVPAAFTKTTGEAHWHVLLRSRAIETGSFVVAPCQYGRHGKAVTYGHSLIVDPWGAVLADGGTGPGVVMAEIELAKVDEARRMIPALRHDRTFSDPHSVPVKRAAG